MKNIDGLTDWSSEGSRLVRERQRHSRSLSSRFSNQPQPVAGLAIVVEHLLSPPWELARPSNYD
jgi:hypothetical protein